MFGNVFGGFEFVLIVPGCSPTQIWKSDPYFVPYFYGLKMGFQYFNKLVNKFLSEVE